MEGGKGATQVKTEIGSGAAGREVVESPRAGSIKFRVDLSVDERGKWWEGRGGGGRGERLVVKARNQEHLS